MNSHEVPRLRLIKIMYYYYYYYYYFPVSLIYKISIEHIIMPKNIYVQGKHCTITSVIEINEKYIF